MYKIILIALLMSCNNINYKYKTNELRRAVEELNVEKVKELLEKANKLDEIDETGKTVLYIATEKRSKEIVEILLNNGANVNNKDKDGWTALMKASQEGFKEIAEILLKNGADVNDKTNIDSELFSSYTSLMFAVHEGYKEIVELLINNGSNVNYEDENGNTLLHIASFFGYKEILELLLDNGAEAVIDKIVSRGTALIIALERNYEELAELLINRGANVNVYSSTFDVAPLHMAVKKGYKKIVERLINEGAIIDKQTDHHDRNWPFYEGNTPLHMGLERGYREITEFLINSGADLNIKDFGGNTAVDISKIKGEYENVFCYFKKYITNKINNDDDISKIWKLLIDLLNNFEMNEKDEESTYIVSSAINKLTSYYQELEKYNLFNLELAVCRLKSPMIFKYHREIESKYSELLKTIIIYIAKCGENLKKLNNIKEEQLELLEQIMLGISFITSKKDGEFKIKDTLPKDIFHVISTHF